MKKVKLIYPELSYKITGIFYKVHNSLGRFRSEKSYADAIENLLQKNKVKYEREKNLGKSFDGENPRRNIVDFIIDNRIIVEVKVKKFITKEDYNQMQRYLNATNLKLGLIVNFRNSYLKPKRVLNYNYKYNYKIKNFHK